LSWPKCRFPSVASYASMKVAGRWVVVILPDYTEVYRAPQSSERQAKKRAEDKARRLNAQL
jgi:hypothetical protein